MNFFKKQYDKLLNALAQIEGAGFVAVYAIYSLIMVGIGYGIGEWLLTPQADTLNILWGVLFFIVSLITVIIIEKKRTKRYNQMLKDRKKNQEK